MSVSRGTVWEPRSSGNSAFNGGGFDPIYGGVDYSQQDAPQATYTDLVSAALPVPPAPTCAALVGGGSFTAATWYVIISWYNSDGGHETIRSAETAIAVGASGRIQITSPVSVGGADSYKIFISNASGGTFFQQTVNFTAIFPIGTDVIVTAWGGGSSPPSSNNLFVNVSSVIRPFTANDVGNVIYVTSGTNYTVRRYQIQRVSGGVATLDRQVATAAAATGGNGRLGGGPSGGLPSLCNVAGPRGGNVIYLKTGYTVGASNPGWDMTLNGDIAYPIRLEGYVATRGDGQRAVVTHNNNSTTVWNVSGQNLHIKNIQCNGAGAATGTFLCTWSLQRSMVENCVFRNNKRPFSCTGSNNLFIRCLFENGGEDGAIFPGSSGLFQNYLLYCRITNCGAGGSGAGHGLNDGDGGVYFANGIIDRNIIGVYHYTARQQTHILQSVIDGNTTAGIQIGLAASSMTINQDPWATINFRQNIFSRNGIAISNVTQFVGDIQYQRFRYFCNAFWANTTKYAGNLLTAPDDVDLTVSPYVDYTVSNYTLNNNAGGGASVQAMDCPGAFADTVNIVSGGVGFGAVDQSGTADPPIAAFEEIQFPSEISRGAKGGPIFKTTVVITGSRAEQRIAQWSDPLYRWDVATGARNTTQADELVAFFLGRGGRATGFRFKDWRDYRTTLESTSQITTTTFQIVKRYVSGAVTRTRNIKKPVAGTVLVFNASNVAVLTGWTVNTITGIVTFSVAPGYVPKVTCEFDVPVRFDTDQMDMEQEDFNIRNWEGIPVVELKF